MLTRTASLRVQALKSFYFAKNPPSLDLIQQSVNWSLKWGGICVYQENTEPRVNYTMSGERQGVT